MPTSTQLHDVYVVSENISAKLKILGYEVGFCQKRSFPPAGRLFFAVQNAVDTMFPYFASLSAWLLQCAGASFSEWSEFDDMNATCQSILQLARGLGFQDAGAAVSVARLCQCVPEPLCDVLDFLCTAALRARGFDTPAPSYAAAARFEEARVDAAADAGDAASGLDSAGGVDEDVPAETLMADPMGAAAAAAAASLSGAASGAGAGAGGSLASAVAGGEVRVVGPAAAQDRALLHSQVSHAQWQLRLEAALPRLHVRFEGAAREWRAHLDDALRHRALLVQDVPEACATLDRLGKQLRADAARIKAREAAVAADLAADGQGLGDALRTQRRRAEELEAEHARVTASVAALSAQLSLVGERVARAKQQAAERNGAMTDTAPLKALQTALRGLREEVSQMDLRIGIVKQTLLAVQARALARQSREDAEARVASAQSQHRAKGALSLTRKVGEAK